MEHIKVGIIEDDKTIRSSLVQCIELYPSLQLSFAHQSIEDALEAFDSSLFNGVDVILQDIGLPGMNGIEGLPYIKQKLPNVDIIMLTTYDDTERIFEALQRGARSYISKKTSLKVIMEAVTTVYRGGSFMSPSIARKLIDKLSDVPRSHTAHEKLTNRQMDIVQGLSKGLSYKMIADQNDISIDTVRSHIKKIYKALEVNSKIEVVNIYNRLKSKV